MKQEIRIIGGQYRGKKLHFPSIEGLRPTPDRVRETLFNWLMHDIRDARCLDAFAGSGALGFEAYSRGAKHVLFLEQAPPVHANLHKIISAFNSPALKLSKVDASQYLQSSKEQFDIVFLDPPFAKNYYASCINDLAQRDVLAPGGLLYVESPTQLEMDERYWQLIKQKQAGQVNYGLYQKRVMA